VVCIGRGGRIAGPLQAELVRSAILAKGVPEAVVSIEIHTSKNGRLWPTEYWKTLIDSMAREGAKHDPIMRYPDLAESVEPFVELREGRHVPTSGSPLAKKDDVAISVIHVSRVPHGSEHISFGEVSLPDTSEWDSLPFPFFGTIGSSEYEAQTKENRDAIEKAWGDQLTEDASAKHLSLSFQLSAGRRDRDLDNLADALMPLFNSRLPSLDEILLLKEPPVEAGSEILRMAPLVC